MIKNIKNVIGFLSFAIGIGSMSDSKIDDTLVAAGDPAVPIRSAGSDLVLSSELQEKVNGLKRFKVCGCSMSPFGISTGDIVYVNDLSSGLNRNDIVIVKVDPEVYNRPIRFNHKMRRYLMDVAKDESIDSVKKRLSEFHKEILVPEFQKRLVKKFNKTKGFYPDRDLCLSITFRNGDLRYSFHPREFMEYKVKFIVSTDTKTLIDADMIPAY